MCDLRKLYQTVYADPPWPEYGGGKIKRGADQHYPLMKVSEIVALPVKELAANNSHLYLWVTNNYLPSGLEVMKAWGFRYITAITWLKYRMGLGQYYRGITEHCLFGVRGNLPYKFTEEGMRAQGVTGFEASAEEHSVKPGKMRVMIEKVSYPPRIELFARRRSYGWDTWGNENV